MHSTSFIPPLLLLLGLYFIFFSPSLKILRFYLISSFPPTSSHAHSYSIIPSLRHDLDLICRAHQVVEDGYEFYARRQLVTIFSAPNYCGEFDNAGAMMSVDDTLMCSFQVTISFSISLFLFLFLCVSISLSLSNHFRINFCHLTILPLGLSFHCHSSTFLAFLLLHFHTPTSLHSFFHPLLLMCPSSSDEVTLFYILVDLM
jgi:hypothetical protein